MSRIGRFELVVFDCDGTLVDSQHAITAAMARAFRDHDLAPPAQAAVRRIIGLNLEEAMAVLAPDEDHASLAEAYKAEFRRQREGGGIFDPLFPGAMDAILAIAGTGARLGVATGKSQRGLRAVLDQHRLRERFVTLQTADDAPGKPHPGMLLNAMAEAGAAPEATIMIGDTTFDMLMARAAKVAALGVAWGYHPAEELSDAGAAAVVADYAGLVPALATL